MLATAKFGVMDNAAGDNRLAKSWMYHDHTTASVRCFRRNGQCTVDLTCVYVEKRPVVLQHTGSQ